MKIGVSSYSFGKYIRETGCDYFKVCDIAKEIGCDIVSPFMTMALIPLACLPELRLTNRGLVDCTKFTFAELEVDE